MALVEDVIGLPKQIVMAVDSGRKTPRACSLAVAAQHGFTHVINQHLAAFYQSVKQ